MSSWMTVNDHLLLLDSWVSLLFHFSSLSPTWHVFARCDFRPEAAAQTQWSRTAAVCLDYSWQQTNDCHCPTLPELCACRMKKTCATGNSVVLAVQSTMNRKVRVLQAGNIAELLRVWRQRERERKELRWETDCQWSSVSVSLSVDQCTTHIFLFFEFHVILNILHTHFFVSSAFFLITNPKRTHLSTSLLWNCWFSVFCIFLPSNRQAIIRCHRFRFVSVWNCTNALANLHSRWNSGFPFFSSHRHCAPFSEAVLIVVQIVLSLLHFQWVMVSCVPSVSISLFTCLQLSSMLLTNVTFTSQTEDCSTPPLNRLSEMWIFSHFFPSALLVSSSANVCVCLSGREKHH